MNISKTLRIVAVFTVAIFTTTTIAWSAPSAYKVNIPEEMGSVTQRFKGEDDALIIHVQDAHSSFEGQKNLAKIICELIPQIESADSRQLPAISRIPFIGIEGAIGSYDLKELRDFPVKQTRERVGAEYVKNGTFIGAEYANILSDNDFTLFGLEDKDLFVKNFKPFYQVMSRSGELAKELERLEGYLDTLRESIYNDALKSFDEKAVAYERGELEFLDYLEHVYTAADSLNIDLMNYISLFQFKELFLLQQSINFKTIDQEIHTLATRTMSSIDEKSDEYARTRRLYEDFLAEKVAQKTIGTYLYFLAQSKNADVPGLTFLASAVDYWHKSSAIDLTSIIREIRTINNDIRVALAKTADETMLISIWQQLLSLKQLLMLKSVREEVEAFRAKPDEYKLSTLYAEIKKLAYRSNVNLDVDDVSIDDTVILEQINTFYRAAEERDAAMLDNLLEQMNTRNQHTGVLVAGGYHSEGLTKLMKERNISYVTVTPKITDVKEDVAYMNRMMGGVVPLDPIYTSPLQTSRINATTGLLSLDPSGFGQEILQKAKIAFKVDGAFVVAVDAETMEPLNSDVASERISAAMQASGNEEYQTWAGALEKLFKGDALQRLLAKAKTDSVSISDIRKELGITIEKYERLNSFIAIMQGELERMAVQDEEIVTEQETAQDVLQRAALLNYITEVTELALEQGRGNRTQVKTGARILRNYFNPDTTGYRVLGIDTKLYQAVAEWFRANQDVNFPQWVMDKFSELAIDVVDFIILSEGLGQYIDLADEERVNVDAQKVGAAIQVLAYIKGISLNVNSAWDLASTAQGRLIDRLGSSLGAGFIPVLDRLMIEVDNCLIETVLAERDDVVYGDRERTALDINIAGATRVALYQELRDSGQVRTGSKILQRYFAGGYTSLELDASVYEAVAEWFRANQNQRFPRWVIDKYTELAMDLIDFVVAESGKYRYIDASEEERVHPDAQKVQAIINVLAAIKAVALNNAPSWNLRSMAQNNFVKKFGPVKDNPFIPFLQRMMVKVDAVLDEKPDDDGPLFEVTVPEVLKSATTIGKLYRVLLIGAFLGGLVLMGLSLAGVMSDAWLLRGFIIGEFPALLYLHEYSHWQRITDIVKEKKVDTSKLLSLRKKAKSIFWNLYVENEFKDILLEDDVRDVAAAGYLVNLKVLAFGIALTLVGGLGLVLGLFAAAPFLVGLSVVVFSGVIFYWAFWKDVNLISRNTSMSVWETIIMLTGSFYQKKSLPVLSSLPENIIGQIRNKDLKGVITGEADRFTMGEETTLSRRDFLKICRALGIPVVLAFLFPGLVLQLFLSGCTPTEQAAILETPVSQASALTTPSGVAVELATSEIIPEASFGDRVSSGLIKNIRNRQTVRAASHYYDISPDIIFALLWREIDGYNFGEAAKDFFGGDSRGIGQVSIEVARERISADRTLQEVIETLASARRLNVSLSGNWWNDDDIIRDILDNHQASVWIVAAQAKFLVAYATVANGYDSVEWQRGADTGRGYTEGEYFVGMITVGYQSGPGYMRWLNTLSNEGIFQGAVNAYRSGGVSELEAFLKRNAQRANGNKLTDEERATITLSILGANRYFNEMAGIFGLEQYVAEETPVQTEPVVVAPEVTSPFEYTVQSGDSLYGLAVRFGVTIDQLLAANIDQGAYTSEEQDQFFNNPSAYILNVGDVLTIPVASEEPYFIKPVQENSFYNVRSGDNLFAIARAHINAHVMVEPEFSGGNETFMVYYTEAILWFEGIRTGDFSKYWELRWRNATGDISGFDYPLSPGQALYIPLILRPSATDSLNSLESRLGIETGAWHAANPFLRDNVLSGYENLILPDNNTLLADQGIYWLFFPQQYNQMVEQVQAGQTYPAKEMSAEPTQAVRLTAKQEHVLAVARSLTSGELVFSGGPSFTSLKKKVLDVLENAVGVQKDDFWLYVVSASLLNSEADIEDVSFMLDASQPRMYVLQDADGRQFITDELFREIFEGLKQGTGRLIEIGIERNSIIELLKALALHELLDGLVLNGVTISHAEAWEIVGRYFPKGKEAFIKLNIHELKRRAIEERDKKALQNLEQLVAEYRNYDMSLMTGRIAEARWGALERDTYGILVQTLSDVHAALGIDDADEEPIVSPEDRMSVPEIHEALEDVINYDTLSMERQAARDASVDVERTVIVIDDDASNPQAIEAYEAQTIEHFAPLWQAQNDGAEKQSIEIISKREFIQNAKKYADGARVFAILTVGEVPQEIQEYADAAVFIGEKATADVPTARPIIISKIYHVLDVLANAPKAREDQCAVISLDALQNALFTNIQALLTSTIAEKLLASIQEVLKSQILEIAA